MVAVLALAGAFVLLQIPPLDSWRYHRVAVWRVTPDELSDLKAKGKPLGEGPSPMTVSPHAPVRLEWSATSPLMGHRYDDFGDSTNRVEGLQSYDLYSGPWIVDVFQSGLVGISRAVGHGSALEGLRPYWEAEPANLWSGTTHGRFLVAPWSDSAPAPADSPWDIGFVTQTVEQPTISFTVSQPYGFYYLPIEDYLIVGGLLLWFAWALACHLRRFVQRRHAVFEDGEAEVASVV